VLRLGGLEVVGNAAVNNLEVTAAAGARGATLDRLHGPVETPAARTGEGTGCAALPLNVVSIAATATAEDVGAPVALAHGGRTLGHCLIVKPMWSTHEKKYI